MVYFILFENVLRVYMSNNLQPFAMQQEYFSSIIEW